MSTIHLICSSCFFEERRGFTFTGTIPLAPDTRCHCGGTVHRIVHLSPGELSNEVEIAYDGDEIVAREREWERLRSQLLSALQLNGYHPRRRRDGVLELVIRHSLKMFFQPVVDQLSHLQGCLVACFLFDASKEDAPNARKILAQINETIGERGLLLGTRRDVFPLDESKPTVIYRRFVPTDELTVKKISELSAWVERIAVFVNEALSTFGFSPASVRFIRNLQMSPKSKESSISRPTELSGSIEIEELLEHADATRHAETSFESLRLHLLEFLRALDIDAQAAIGNDPNQLDFHYHGIGLKVFYRHDHRDSYLQVVAQVAHKLKLDENLDSILMTLSRSLTMGHIQLHEQQEGVYNLTLEDTILGNDLNADELAKVLTNVALQAETFADSIAANHRVDHLLEGVPLDGLVNFVNMRALQQSHSPDLPRLSRRVSNYLAQLDLYPRVSGNGDLRLSHRELPVFIKLGEMVPDSYLTIGVTIVSKMGVPRHSAWERIAVRPPGIHLGGFKLHSDGSLTYEDTILGNSLDLNELAKTLQEVLLAAEVSRETLRTKFEADELGFAKTISRDEAISGLASVYRHSYDRHDRARIVRALAMFAHPIARESLFGALRDPSPFVGDLAACGLVAGINEGGEELHHSLSELALDTTLSDRVRKRALRILSETQFSQLPPQLGKIALNPRESLDLRQFALRSINARPEFNLSEKELMTCLEHPSETLQLAALTAANKAKEHSSKELTEVLTKLLPQLVDEVNVTGELLSFAATLGLQPHIVEAGERGWELSIELARGVVNAAASMNPPDNELLQRILAHPQGEHRRAVYEAIGEHRICALAPAISGALSQETDENLKAIAIKTLVKLGVLSRSIADTLQRVGRHAHVRSLAHDALQHLRSQQMRRFAKND